MAPFRPAVAILFLLALLVAAGAAAHLPTAGCRRLARYARVLCFGDSLTDTGNAAIFPSTAGGPSTRPPYGETHFGRPTGRASDGRLVIDFLVEGLKVPQPTPYLAERTAADLLNGTNFAVGGATALDPAFLASRGVMSSVPVSLSNETTWFHNVLQLLGGSSSEHELRKITASSVFYVGEIGLNDYIYALIDQSVDVAASLVPHIIGAIRLALTEMVSAGARTLLVTGMLPLGCEPQLLAVFPGDDHDPATGCVARLNELAELHNRALERMLGELRRAHPGRLFLYADIYRHVIRAVASPGAYGFGGRPLAACCGGGGGKYNFDFAAFCGAPGTAACADPSEFVSWDGVHFTEAANRLIARAILRGLRRRRAIAATVCPPSARLASPLVTAE